MKEEVKTCDIAIYGFGLASVFFLLSFINTKVKICVFEKGDKNKPNKLNTIDKFTGPFKYGQNNNPERLSGAYGTAQAWNTKGVGGKLWKYENEDFINYQWPINLKKLEKYYSKAVNKLEKLTGLNIKDDFKAPKKNELTNFFSQKNFSLKNYSTSLSYNFKSFYDNSYKIINNSKNINISYNHMLLDFDYNLRNKKILSTTISSNTKKIKVIAKNHILALGTIETNRVLLNILKKEKHLLMKYQIGKKITYHPTIGIGYYDLKKNLKKKKLLKLHNFYKKILIIKSKKKMHHSLVLGVEELREGTFLKRKIFDKFFGYIKKITLGLAFEHTPNAKSRIILSNKVARDGMKKINIKTFFEKKSINQVYKLKNFYQNYFSKYKLFGSSFKYKDYKINFETNNHHHGGIIFGGKNNCPADKNFKIKFLKNVFVLGACIFPSSGIYGPTFTIIALAEMLAEKILCIFKEK